MTLLLSDKRYGLDFLLREDLTNSVKYTQKNRLLHTYRLGTDVQLSESQADSAVKRLVIKKPLNPC
jgi:hypothetical protein